MYFANPWGLLGLAALPAIVLIHLYQRRFPPLVVAGLHLWSSDTRQPLAGRRRERLPLTASLLFELLAALLLGLALGDPHVGEFDKARHLVIVLDNSASMAARPPQAGAASFRDAAAAEAERRIRALPRGSVTTLIVTGRRPELLGGLLMPVEDALGKLSAWQPRTARHTFDPAWDEALDLAQRSGAAGDALFLTDQLPPAKDIPPRLEVVAVGRKLDNAAIAAARWTYDPLVGRGRVFLRVHNLGARETHGEVRGRRGARVVFTKPLSLPAGGAASIEAEVPGGLERLTVELSTPPDGLALDNRVELVEPRVRGVKIANNLPQGVAFSLFERVLKSLPAVQFGKTEQAQLVLAPAGQLPESNARLWWVGVGPISNKEADRQQARDVAGPYLLEKREPLLDGVTLGGVVWGGVQPLLYDAAPLISAGNSVLLGRLNGTRTAAFVLNIDLERSNLAESPDWPIFLSNLVELRRADLPGLDRWNYQLGEPVRFSLAEAALTGAAAERKLLLKHGAAVKALERTSPVEIAPLTETGVYEILDGESLIDRFAVNFHDLAESDLKRLEPGRRAAAQPARGEVALDNPYSLLIAAAVLLILLAVLSDWYVLRGAAALSPREPTPP